MRVTTSVEELVAAVEVLYPGVVSSASGAGRSVTVRLDARRLAELPEVPGVVALLGTVTVDATLLHCTDGVAALRVTSRARVLPLERLLRPALFAAQRLGGVDLARFVTVETGASGVTVLAQVRQAVAAATAWVRVDDLDLQDGKITVDVAATPVRAPAPAAAVPDEARAPGPARPPEEPAPGEARAGDGA
ncbi:hypothetical protein [Georgenia sp. AZ-5]|uniref:hypothetical protein n=1 Tax=Georgenia sp. AZ-5 TaxID=3367526 RepID=UPI0037553603